MCIESTCCNTTLHHTCSQSVFCFVCMFKDFAHIQDCCSNLWVVKGVPTAWCRLNLPAEGGHPSPWLDAASRLRSVIFLQGGFDVHRWSRECSLAVVKGYIIPVKTHNATHHKVSWGSRETNWGIPDSLQTGRERYSLGGFSGSYVLRVTQSGH